MNLKNGLLLLIVILGLVIFRTEMVLRSMQDERSTDQFQSIVQTIQTNAEGTPKPTATPNRRDTLHVTQRVGRDDPDMIDRLLEALRGKK